MATIKVRKDKNGKIRNYKITACIGRDEHYKQIWRTTTLERPEGLTPKKEEKEIQRQADAWEIEQRLEYEKNRERESAQKRAEKKKITLSEFIDNHWMPKHVKNGEHTPDTISFYNFLGKDIKSYFDEKQPRLKLADVDKESVLDYLAWMRNEAVTRKGTPYSKTTIQHHFSTLRNILEYAVYVDYIAENPCKKIKPGDKPKREQHDIDFLDEEQALRFLACLDSETEKEYWKKQDSTNLFWKSLVNTLILTGLRRGELVGLRWGDMNKKNLSFSVRRNVTIDTNNEGETEPEKKIHVGELKGKRTRTIAISKYLLDLLESFKAEQDEKYGTLMPSAYIFSRADNPYLPIYPTEPTRLMRKYIKRHKLPDVSPHDLRHTAASLAIEAGADVKQIQALLGHRDPAMTLKFYAGITEAKQREAVDGIEGLLRPKKSEDGQKAE